MNTELNNEIPALPLPDFKVAMQKDNTIVLDTRNATVFADGFIPGSISIGLEGRFEEWAGSLLPVNHSILLLTEEGKEQETIDQLARINFDNIDGYLQGGFEAWKQGGEEIDLLINVEADEVAMDIPFDDKIIIVDVRKEVEYANGHVKNAINIPLGKMRDPLSISGFEETDNLYIHCESGYRSVIASSLLKHHGIHNLRNIVGGYHALQAEDRIDTEKSTEVLN